MRFCFLAFFLALLLGLVDADPDAAADALALLSFKRALRDPSPALDSWSPAGLGSVCSWRGVRCDDADRRVAAVDITNMNIHGSVGGGGAPVKITVSGLESLVNFSIAGNGLVGSLVLSGLPSLRHVNISGNQLVGGLDWDFPSMPDIEVLDVYDNNLTALLPVGVTKLRRLRHLDLGGNYFYGEVPAEYGDMPAIEYLSLNGNNLHGKIPPELGNLTSLRQLYLGYYNAFDGGIPAELGRLRRLVHLDLSSCGISGGIPPDLGDLSALDTLFLHSNQLSGPIPPELGKLKELASLDLSNNALVGEIPGELAALTNLRLLNLFMNQLDGPLPAFLAELPALETVQLFVNNLTGGIPPRLGANAPLRLVDLSSNRLTGAVPGSVCQAGRLKTLILMNNFLFGSLPAELGSCSSLTRVRLGHNYINGSIPPGLLYLPQLNLLELNDNLLSGALSENPHPAAPAQAQPSQLAQLSLSNNLITGAIPSSVANWSNIETLLLGKNRLTGPIPAAIGELRRLVKLDLSGNKLSGVIPPLIAGCGDLTYLDLSKNDLSGPIPVELAGVQILNYLNVSWNHLNESIPEQFGALRSLTAVDFSFNDLSGPVPEIGQLAYMNGSAFAGNRGLCGPAVSVPCGNGSFITPQARLRQAAGDFRLAFALGLLACSVAFAVAAVWWARAYRAGPAVATGGTWKFTAFHKVDFGLADVLECMKEGNVVGRGGAGVVYVGRTRSGGSIAVKRLVGLGSSGAGGSSGHDHGFRAEIRTLGSIRHRNIVRLLAFCTNQEANVLVYEYMWNGSLGEVLHGKGGGFLGWARRYRIAVEAARGLCYLHHDCTPMIVHRDVKSNNILLGDDFEAHVADFGLAKFLRRHGGCATESMSAVAGSYGYIAPEYAYTLKVDEKSDVYSFGVVLLELITGRRPVGGFGEGVDIVQWTKLVTGWRRENVSSIVDPRLSTIPLDEVMHLFFIAMLCVQENSVERPTMREVVQMLSEHPHHESAQLSAPSPPRHEEKSPDEQPHCYKLFQ